jgi:hypothetical protein
MLNILGIRAIQSLSQPLNSADVAQITAIDMCSNKTSFTKVRQPTGFGPVGCNLPALILNINHLALGNETSPRLNSAVLFI